MSRRAHPLFACWACCSILLVAANPVLGCDETSPIYRPVLDLFEFTGIITAEGRALAGVEVRCVFADHYARASFGPVEMTDQHGRFQIRSRVERFKLVAVHPDYRREVSGWLTREEVSIDLIELDLKPGVQVHGRVYDALGEPVANALLRLYNPTLEIQDMHRWQENRVAMPERITSDATGAFEFEAALGMLTLTARAPDRASSEQVLDLVLGQANDSEGRRYLAVQLEDGPTATGRVELDGVRLANVLVSWKCSDYRYSDARTLSGPRGEFTLKQLRGIENCTVAATPRSDLSRRSTSAAVDGFIATHVLAVVGERDILLSLHTEDSPGSMAIRFDGAYEFYTGNFELIPRGDTRTTTPTRAKKNTRAARSCPLQSFDRACTCYTRISIMASTRSLWKSTLKGDAKRSSPWRCPTVWFVES